MNHGVVILCSVWYNEILWQIPYNLPMKMKLTQYLTCFLLCGIGLGVWGWYASQNRQIDQEKIWEVSANDGEGNELVKKAVKAVVDSPPFEADINCTFNVYGTQIHAPGRYYQQGQGSGKVRLYIKASIDGQLASLLRVSDGRFLYSRIDLPQEQKVTRVDLQKVNEELNDRLTPAANVWDPNITLGGLAYLLTRLDEDFAFAAPVADKLGEVPIWRLRGTWKKKSLQQMIQMQTGQGGDLENPFEMLPSHVPTQIELVCARENRPQLFPYQIRFYGRPKPEFLDSLRESAGESSRFDKEPPLIASIEFQRVVLNAEIDESLFRYDPGEDEIEYRTDEFIASLKTRFPDEAGGQAPNLPAPLTR